MIIPVRCFTCGKLVGDKWEQFASRVEAGEAPDAVLDSLGLRRPCCRRMLITHIDFADELMEPSPEVAPAEGSPGDHC